MKFKTDRRKVPGCIFVAVLAVLVTQAAGAAGAAASCKALQAQIEARIRAAGVAQFTLTTVDAGARAVGKVVGTCALGTQKIMYIAGASAAPMATPSAAASTPRARAAPSRPGTEAILTECRDGTVSMGGDCKK
ncbi:MAG: DUF1161 domain-containing protein [Burkholderiaceae bacterium]|nr:DUF1161 domain-containing protein [Burkholderiaceae bacterium]MDZ4144970.1 DUF1161 domain-containing protein [Burkholderiales bacterium]